MPRVKWTPRAYADLGEIILYIAEDNRTAALRMAARIRAAVKNLGRHPTLGRLGRVESTRELIIVGTPYIVAYRVGTAVEIVGVMHGAREWPEEFD